MTVKSHVAHELRVSYGHVGHVGHDTWQWSRGSFVKSHTGRVSIIQWALVTDHHE